MSPVPTTVYPLIEAGEIGAIPGKDGERREGQVVNDCLEAADEGAGPELDGHGSVICISGNNVEATSC